MIGTFMNITAPSVAYIDNLEEIVRNTSNQKGILALRNLSFECKEMLKRLDKLQFEVFPEDLSLFDNQPGNYRRALMGRDIRGLSDEENKEMRKNAIDAKKVYKCTTEGVSDEANEILSEIYMKKNYIEKIIEVIDDKDNIYLKFCAMSSRSIDNETSLAVYKSASKLKSYDVIREVRSYITSVTNKRNFISMSTGVTSIIRLLNLIHKNQESNIFSAPTSFDNIFSGVSTEVSRELDNLNIYGVNKDLANLKGYVEPFEVLTEVGSQSGIKKMENVLVNAISKELRGV